MTIEILAESIAALESLTQSVGGRIAVAISDARELWVVDLSVSGGAWTRDPLEADCTLVATRRALAAFGDASQLQDAIEAGELAVLGATEKLQAIARLIDDGPGWARARIAA